MPGTVLSILHTLTHFDPDTYPVRLRLSPLYREEFGAQRDQATRM